jgi:hypothetical protein
MMERKKHWIQKALEKPGGLTAAAKRAGKKTAEFAEEHDEDPGTLGRRARLAETLLSLRKGKSNGQSA